MKQKELPLLPIRDPEIVIFPGQCCDVDFARVSSLNAIAIAQEKYNNRIIIAIQNNETISTPKDMSNFYSTCVEAEIKQAISLPSDDDQKKMRIIFRGIQRHSLESVSLKDDLYYICKSKPIDVVDVAIDKTLRDMTKSIKEIIKKNFSSSIVLKNTSVPITSIDLSCFIDEVACQLKISQKNKINILEAKDLKERLEFLMVALTEVLTERPSSKSHDEDDSVKSEIDKIEENIKKANMPPDALKIAEQEVRRLRMMSPSGSEFQVNLNYVEQLVGLPWAKSSEDRIDLDVASKCLDEDHYGLGKVKERIVEFLAVRKLAPNQKGSILCLAGPPGSGKAQPLDALVLTPTGYIQMGEVSVNTTIMTPSGDVAKVTGVFPQGMKDIYKVMFSDGTSTECCDEHLWLTETSAYRRWKSKNGKSVKPLSEIRNTLRCGADNRINHSIPAVEKIDFIEGELPIHPYLLGSLLGDGTLSKIAFSSQNKGMVSRVRKYLGAIDCKMVKVSKYDYNISQKSKKVEFNFSGKDNKSQIHKALLDLNLYGTHSWDKFIPNKYLYSSFNSRLELLRGILDTDGSMIKSTIDYSSASKDLCDGVKFLVESLGGRATYYISESSYTYKEQKMKGRIRHRLYIHMPKNINPFRLDYKKEAFIKFAKKTKSYKRYIVDVQLVGKKEAQCIMLDHPDHLYITNNFIITHNTSICKSIARAMSKEYVRISLGGLHDEAEIRGHRKTYIGAMPGRIIQSLKKVGVNNPIFVLDEIDKLSKDYRGDPSSALLEVLDPEQNGTFQDNYINTPFDLSKVFFITTANDLGSIPQALRDRLEIIEVPGYSPFDKLRIAQNYLIPKQKKENGLDDLDITISENALARVIEEYTNEAGVRRLERYCGTIMRKIAVQVVSGKKPLTNVTISAIPKLLGPPKVFADKANDTPFVGVSTGLAWSQNGGSILFVESMLTPGKGNIKVSGNVGKVLEESANAAFTWIKSHAKEFNVDMSVVANNDIHVHLPAGGTPKDGPSAGIAIASSLLSTIVDSPIRNDIAMTGEISLRGRVLPIGGLKEKVLAAHRAGIKMVIFPKDNSFDLEEIPADVLSEIKMVPVSELKEAIDLLMDVNLNTKKTVIVSEVIHNALEN